MRLGGLLDTEALAEASEAKKKGKANPVALKNAETAAKREERLANKGMAAPAMGGGGSAPVPEPDVDKSALLDKIGAYREKFPHVKSRNKVSGKASLEEIEDELAPLYIASESWEKGFDLLELTLRAVIGSGPALH